MVHEEGTIGSAIQYIVDEQRHAGMALGAFSSHAPPQPPSNESHNVLAGCESAFVPRAFQVHPYTLLVVIFYYVLGTVHQLSVGVGMY